VFVALGETGRGYRYASQPRNGGRNNGEKRIGHDISRSKVNAAYKIISHNFRNSATILPSPANVSYRAEFYFIACWIALRFPGDPRAALADFVHVD
jgi:hypothetical protein